MAALFVPMDIGQSYFELFGLSERFALDAAKLDAAYLRLQAEVHPDRFVHAGAAEQRVALQWATQVNAAYQALRDPRQRAAYLCVQHGVDIEGRDNSAMPAEFLLLQMESRETLADAADSGDVDALAHLSAANRKACREVVAAIGRQIDSENDFTSAAQSVHRLMFLEKLGEDIDAALEAMEA